jgi:hypothetical protein
MTNVEILKTLPDRYKKYVDYKKLIICLEKAREDEKLKHISLPNTVEKK